MYELTRKAGEAFPKKYDGIDLHCLQINLRIMREVHILNTARQRRASQHYHLVRPGNVRVIWPDIYVSMALLQILCKLLKIWTSLGI